MLAGQLSLRGEKVYITTFSLFIDVLVLNSFYLLTVGVDDVL